MREAFIVSLESQLSSARAELAGQYKVQSQNAQRLLDLTESLRTHELAASSSAAQLQQMGTERERLQRALADGRAALAEKDRTITLLQDELNMLNLELGQVEMRNDALRRDNASLLQRWLDRMNAEASGMNEANRLAEEQAARKKKEQSEGDGK